MSLEPGFVSKAWNENFIKLENLYKEAIEEIRIVVSRGLDETAIEILMKNVDYKDIRNLNPMKIADIIELKWKIAIKDQEKVKLTKEYKIKSSTKALRKLIKNEVLNESDSKILQDFENVLLALNN